MVEKIIEVCARHRWLVILGVAIALVAGAVAMKRVKLDALPDLSDPQVIVFTDWMGRSPTLIEDQVTYPIVSKLISTPHVRDVRGFSMFGMSFVYIVFDEGTDIYWARSRVLEYMNSLKAALPEGATPTLGPMRAGSGGLSNTRSPTRRASTASTSYAPFRTSPCATRSAACLGSPRWPASAVTRSSIRSPSIRPGYARTA
jgi:Cu/Ag efflux pump CusA